MVKNQKIKTLNTGVTLSWKCAGDKTKGTLNISWKGNIKDMIERCGEYIRQAEEEINETCIISEKYQITSELKQFALFNQVSYTFKLVPKYD